MAKVTKEIKNADREQIAELSTSIETKKENQILLELPPVMIHKIKILAELDNNISPEIYIRKVLEEFIANRQYLINRTGK